MTVFSCIQFLGIALLIGATTADPTADAQRGVITDTIIGGPVTALNITMGLAERVPSVIPKPSTVFQAGKQTIAGYPLAVVSSAINELCSSVNSVNAIKSQITPDINKMAFQLMTTCKNYSIPILQAKDLWNHPAFDRTKKVVILATGWTTSVNDAAAIYYIGKGYLCRGDVNFIAFDAAGFVDTLYTWAALNTEEIGLHISTGLVELAKIVDPDNIHLIGHSLGAHIVGSAGRNFYWKTGKMIKRITGLDPAKPCFKEGENLSGLQRGDAEFIDVIHSNSGVLGKRDPTGDIDFYPNGLSPLPPKCLTTTCAHARAWEYYAESVYPGAEENFMGVRCGSLTALRTGKCPGKSVRMGYDVPIGVKGNFFMEVNGEKPYGKTSNRRAPDHSKCGLCANKIDKVFVPFHI